MANRSTFPTTIDEFITHYDVSASDKVSIKRFKDLTLKDYLNAEEQVELQNLTTILRDKIFTPEDFNKLQDCITNIENFFLNQTTGYLQIKQAEWDAILQQFSDQGLWSNTSTYKQWNTVSYSNETFLSKQNNNINHIPTGGVGDIWWQRVALRGGQGVAGLGLSYVGSYNNTTSYTVGNAVKYNTDIYYCVQNSTGNLPTDSNYWQIFMSSTGIAVQSTPPTNPAPNTLWVDIS